MQAELYSLVLLWFDAEWVLNGPVDCSHTVSSSGKHQHQGPAQTESTNDQGNAGNGWIALGVMQGFEPCAASFVKSKLALLLQGYVAGEKAAAQVDHATLEMVSCIDSVLLVLVSARCAPITQASPNSVFGQATLFCCVANSPVPITAKFLDERNNEPCFGVVEVGEVVAFNLRCAFRCVLCSELSRKNV